MKKELGKILFLGSIAGESAESVMRLCAKETGNHITFLPDGETGKRRHWVHFLAADIYHEHPSIITLQRPEPREGKDGWYSEGYDEKNWLFKIKEDIKEVHFEQLGYAEEALTSYKTFSKLRNSGVIPKDVKFQVSLPLTESATRLFVTNQDDFEIMKSGFENVMVSELRRMLQVIPADDLVIQWDMALEVLFTVLDGATPWSPQGSPLGRLLKTLNLFASQLPSQVLMGCHLCYGDLGHKHLVEPADLALAVDMANKVTKGVLRTVDYFHMPVPINRLDDPYYAPLYNLKIGTAKLYLGLIHHSDGITGTENRIKIAKKYVSEFGVATECGMARRDPATIPDLLRIHREAAEILTSF
jgi:hypothetical protein